MVWGSSWEFRRSLGWIEARSAGGNRLLGMHGASFPGAEYCAESEEKTRGEW